MHRPSHLRRPSNRPNELPPPPPPLDPADRAKPIEQGGTAFAPNHPPITHKPRELQHISEADVGSVESVVNMAALAPPVKAPEGPFMIHGVDLSKLPVNVLKAMAEDETVMVSANWTDEDNERARTIARYLVGHLMEMSIVNDPTTFDSGLRVIADETAHQAAVNWLKQDLQKTIGDLMDSRFSVQHREILDGVLEDVVALAQMTVGGGVDKKTLIRAQAHIVAQLANITAFNLAQITQAVWGALGRYIQWGFKFALDAAGVLI